jgi:hypothetical protein
MSNGSPYAVAIPPDALRCPHIHNTAAVAPTSINPDPNCRGRCRLVKGHPHPGVGTHASSAVVAESALYLVNEGVEFLGVWQYNPGGCCLCEVCGKWVKDWILGSPPHH